MALAQFLPDKICNLLLRCNVNIPHKHQQVKGALITKAFLNQNPCNMKRALTFTLILTFVGGFVYGQQDPMFTKYMFNSLIFNPAYAGSKDHLSVGLLHRTQWIGIDGAPSTQTITIHTPLRDERVGIGLSLINDEIGPTNTLGVNLSYAYRIPLGKGKLSIGIQAGFENYKANFSDLILQNVDDPPFQTNEDRFLPNFGAGIYYYSKYFYIGASSPQLVEYDLRDNIGEVNIYARQVRHYYFMMGAAIPLNGDALIFKPSILVKNAGLFKSSSKLEGFKDIGAPNEFDLDISFLFQEALWVGASVRSAFAAINSDKSSFDSADIWVSYLFTNGLRLGMAYDYPLSQLSNVTNGSIEVMVGYEFNYKTKKAVTPRYF